MRPTPGSQLALFATYSYHGFITDREGEGLWLEADHRRHAEVENAIRDLKRRPQSPALRPLRRQRRLAGRPGDRPQPRSLDGAPRPRRGHCHHAHAAAAAVLSTRAAHALCSPPHLHLPERWPWAPRLQRTPSPACGRSHSRLTPPPFALAARRPRASLPQAVSHGATPGNGRLLRLSARPSRRSSPSSAVDRRSRSRLDHRFA